MRVAALYLLLAVTACSDDPPIAGETIVIDAPAFTLQPGEPEFSLSHAPPLP